MKRICHYSPATHLGGAERSMLDLAEGMHGSGFEPWVLLPRDTGPLIDQLEKRGIDFEVQPMPEILLSMSRTALGRSLWNGLSAIPGLNKYLQDVSRFLRQKKTDLVHTNGIKCHALSALVYRKVPRLWHLRDIFKRGATRTLLKTLRSMSKAHVVANSYATLNSIFPSGSRRSVVYNGIDPANFPIQRNTRFQDFFKTDPQTKIVGILGILTRWKGQIEFLRMAQQLLSQGLNVRFVVVGGEIYDTMGEQGFTEVLKAEAERLGITEQVLFTGFTENPAEALNGMDLLVHASIRPEPFGRVILEGWACQIPVVASHAGGVPEFTEHEKTALTFPPGDVDAMTKCVCRLLEDPSLAETLARNGNVRLHQGFTGQHYIEGILDLYRRIFFGSKQENSQRLVLGS